MGAAVVGALAALMLLPVLPGRDDLRLLGFDAYQRLWPRVPVSAPAVIVEVDEPSLARHGQWPWPRALLAELLERILAGSPAAVGLDLVMPEPDRVSPDRIAPLVARWDPELARRLRGWPGGDTVLASAIRTGPVVLGLAGLPAAPEGSASPFRRPPVRVTGGDPLAYVRRYPAVLRSVDALEAAAAGHGLLNPASEGDTVRRMPLVAAVGDALVPGLGLEMLRVAGGVPRVDVAVGSSGIESVALGDLVVRAEPDGTVWIPYGPHSPGRFVSAADVLAGRVPPERFGRRLVLVGVTAVGLVDQHATPVAPRMPGVEIHAQQLEGIFDGTLLSRPRWARWLEGGLLAITGGALVLAVPAWPVGGAAVLAAAGAALLGTGAALFLRLGLLVDVLGPLAGGAVAYTLMQGLGLAEADRQRRALRREVQRNREAAARLAGELEAARRIQMGTLPEVATAFPGERRFSVYAAMEPARVVGGDLYDVFLLDRDRLFVLIGDVSGKGLAGSLFMAMSKVLCKSAALRRDGDLEATLEEVNVELSRDDGEALFVTMLALVLDVRSGQLTYVNAGHEHPYVVSADGVRRLTGGGGPPLCVLDGFAYRVALDRLEPGQLLCLVTDGLPEAEGPAGRQYGRERLEASLAGLRASASAEAVGRALLSDVEDFVAGVEASDDRAVVIVRWTGPADVSEP